MIDGGGGVVWWGGGAVRDNDCCCTFGSPVDSRACRLFRPISPPSGFRDVARECTGHGVLVMDVYLYLGMASCLVHIHHPQHDVRTRMH